MKTYKFTLDINSDDPGKRIANELETILGKAEMEVDVLYEASNESQCRKPSLREVNRTLVPSILFRIVQI